MSERVFACSRATRKAKGEHCLHIARVIDRDAQNPLPTLCWLIAIWNKAQRYTEAAAGEDCIRRQKPGSNQTETTKERARLVWKQRLFCQQLDKWQLKTEPWTNVFSLRQKVWIPRTCRQHDRLWGFLVCGSQTITWPSVSLRTEPEQNQTPAGSEGHLYRLYISFSLRPCGQSPVHCAKARKRHLKPGGWGGSWCGQFV